MSVWLVMRAAAYHLTTDGCRMQWMSARYVDIDIQHVLLTHNTANHTLSRPHCPSHSDTILLPHVLVPCSLYALLPFYQLVNWFTFSRFIWYGDHLSIVFNRLLVQLRLLMSCSKLEPREVYIQTKITATLLFFYYFFFVLTSLERVISISTRTALYFKFSYGYIFCSDTQYINNYFVFRANKVKPKNDGKIKLACLF